MPSILLGIPRKETLLLAEVSFTMYFPRFESSFTPAHLRSDRLPARQTAAAPLFRGADNKPEKDSASKKSQPFQKELDSARQMLEIVLQKFPVLRRLEKLLDTLPTTEGLVDQPERAALHREIVSNLYGEGAVKQSQRADIVIGLPGAGKSTILKEILKNHRGLLVDSDVIKEFLPESRIDPDLVDGKFSDTNYLNSASTAIESNIIRDKILDKALPKGDNVAIPIVGSNFEDIQSLIKKLGQAGYSIYFTHVELPLPNAVQRVVHRTFNDERHVGLSYLVNGVQFKPRENMEKIKELFKKGGPAKGYMVYSTDVPLGKPPILLERRMAERDFSMLDAQLEHTESPEFQASVAQVFEDARNYLLAQKAAGNNGMVVLDVDDTVLDHREYYRDPDKIYYRHPDQPDWWVTWQAWIEAVAAPAIPAAKEFVNWLDDNDIPYAYVTTRLDREKDYTIEDLANDQLVGPCCLGIYCKPDTFWSGTSRSHKAAIRQELEEKFGLPVLASIGDKSQDMTDDPEKNFLLPTSFYQKHE